MLVTSGLRLALLAVGAYLLGSVPFGLVFAKVFCKTDPRLEGSKNVGATNVARLCGKFWGLATLLCDALKGALPVAFARFGCGFSLFESSLVALAALVGHTFSIFLRFRGGKGVATTVGIFLPLAICQLAGAAVLCLVVIYATGFVSAGSLVLISALVIFEAATWLLTGNWQVLPLSVIVLAIVAVRHRENIGRLLRGEEKPWQKKKNDQ